MVNKNGTWEKQFYHEDHLGSNRVVYAANGNKLEVVEQTDYDPFGMELAHSTSGNPKEIYHFQGKEKIERIERDRTSMLEDFERYKEAVQSVLRTSSGFDSLLAQIDSKYRKK